jgi:hypothetical protein
VHCSYVLLSGEGFFAEHFSLPVVFEFACIVEKCTRHNEESSDHTSKACDALPICRTPPEQKTADSCGAL